MIGVLLEWFARSRPRVAQPTSTAPGRTVGEARPCFYRLSCVATHQSESSAILRGEGQAGACPERRASIVPGIGSAIHLGYNRSAPKSPSNQPRHQIFTLHFTRHGTEDAEEKGVRCVPPSLGIFPIHPSRSATGELLSCCLLPTLCPPAWVCFRQSCFVQLLLLQILARLCNTRFSTGLTANQITGLLISASSPTPLYPYLF